MATILITGTTRGLGQFLRQHLVSAGHDVFGSGRGAVPHDSRSLVLDVTNPEDCQRAVQEVLARSGRLDVLVNNAGSHLLGAATETSDAELRAQLELNFFGAVNMLRAAVPQFISQRSGRIVNISSVGGLFATPFASAYSASKFALEGYTEALRFELQPFGVFVSNLEPGFLATGTTDVSVVPVQGRDVHLGAVRDQVFRHMQQQGPAGSSLQSVAQTVDEILKHKRPRLRYSVDGLATRLAVLRAVSPGAFFERMVVQQTAPGLAQMAPSLALRP
jgi:NAD(P)-dependent dehydrogenase (short-subunit alcohol dehydrogenase family)